MLKLPRRSDLDPFLALDQFLPKELVTEVLTRAHKQSQRVRKLPADLVTLLVVALGLFRALSISEVLWRVAERFGSAAHWRPGEAPHSTSICQARDRLGWKVIRTLFKRTVAALSKEYDAEWRWRGFLVKAIDGFTLRLPDSKENEAYFGRPPASRGGKSGFPQCRGVVVSNVFSHLITDAFFGPYCESELALAAKLARNLKRGTLLLADRLYFTYAWVGSLLLMKIHFAIRSKTGSGALKIRKSQTLPDGSKLVEFHAPTTDAFKTRSLPKALTLRLVTIHPKGFRPITIITSLLDHEAYPAAEIGGLYYKRWEIELSLREAKTYQLSKFVPLRSKKPERILQEAFGLLLAYNCVRGLMAKAAKEKGLRPLELSFKACLHRTRMALSEWKPEEAASFERRLLESLGRCRIDAKRVGRCCPRAVKVKVSKWPRKRPGSATVANTRKPRSAKKAGQNLASKSAVGK